MHVEIQQLRSYIDNELGVRDSALVSDHISTCDACRRQYRAMQSSADFARESLMVMEPRSNEMSDQDKVPLLAQSLAADKGKNPPGRLRQSFAFSRPVWATLLAFAIAVAALNFQPVRSWASEFLAIFRVQQIQVVELDPANLQRFRQQFFNSETAPRLEQLFADNAVVSGGGPSKRVADRNEAGRHAGFGVRLPHSLGAPSKINVHPGAHITVKINVETMQAILQDAGRGDIKLPEELNGQTVYVNIPSGVTAAYGKCPEQQSTKSNEPPKRQRRSRYPDCRIVAQLPAPSVAAPAGFDASQLGELFLQLTGMKDDEAKRYSEMVNWASTLVVPLPMERGTDFSYVSADGNDAVLIVTDYDGAGGPDPYTLIWLKNGILYSILGYGTAADAISIADSMQ